MERKHIAGLVGAGAAIGAAIYTGVQCELGKSDWAAWVQAVGSIAALAVAIFVMSRQNSHAAKLMADADRLALRRRAAAVSAVIDRANRQLNNCIAEISKEASGNNFKRIHPTWVACISVIDECLRSVEAIPAHELGSYEMTEGLFKTVDALRAFNVAAHTWIANTTLYKDLKEITDMAVVLQKQSDEAHALFAAGVRSLG